MNQSIRYQIGWENLKKIDGEAGEKVIESLKDIAPDLGRFIIEYSFGDIYSRPGLDLKSKELAVVAALTAMGNAAPQLKVHLNGALNVGCSISEVKEIILQMSSYAGFPSSINAMALLKTVLEQRQSEGHVDTVGETEAISSFDNRFEQGKIELSKLDDKIFAKLNDNFKDLCPDLVKFVIEYGYADIYSRRNVDIKYRQIGTIAALTALGTASSQLKFHINAGLNIGLSVEIIAEIMLLMTIYAGFPSAINGINILKEVVNERKLC